LGRERCSLSRVGQKIDGLTVKVPWNENFHAILKELYTVEEADLIVRIPIVYHLLNGLKKSLKIEETKLRKLLDGLCAKGLILDIEMKGDYFYMISPMVIGVFEFTMMRTGGHLNSRQWAKLFNAYMHGEQSFMAANCVEDDQVSILRALPHEGTVAEEDFVEVLDYEKASSYVESSNRFSIGLCSCRHEKLSSRRKEMRISRSESCASFGMGADFLIRNNLAREISKTEMLEHLARSRESGLVLSADNVKKNITAICSCCGCCCNVLLGISRFGYNGILVTSNFISYVDEATCNGCGKCARACPINAIEMSPVSNPDSRVKSRDEN